MFFLSCLTGFVLWMSRPAISSTEDVHTTARPELVLQTGHTSGVNCVAFGPGGRWLASGGSDNAIKIWEVASGRELRALRGHTGYVKALAVSADGHWLASGSNDLSVRVWDVVTGQELHNFSGHLRSVESVSFSQDGRWLASGSGDNSIRIWDLTAGGESQLLKGHAGAVVALAFSSDGKLLASGSADRSIELWDTGTWREKAKLQKHNDGITSLAFSPDNKSLASASADGSIYVWKQGSDQERFVIKGTARVLALAFTDNVLRAASADGAIREWDTTNGKEKGTKRPAAGKQAAETLMSVAFSPDGKYVAATAGRRTVALLDSRNGKTVRTFESRSTGFYAVAVSSDGKWLASGANDRFVRLWQVANGQQLPRMLGSSGVITSISFSHNNRFLVSGSISGEVKVWDLRSGREAYKLTSSPRGINSVSFSSNGKWLGAAGGNRTIQLWDVATRSSRILAGHDGEVTSISFSPQEELLASAGRDKTIRLWDPNSGQLLRILATLADDVDALTFSPDGKSLAVGCADKTITIWEVAGGRLMKTLTGHNGEVLALAFSPDRPWLVSGSSDHTARIWDVESGSEIQTLVRGAGNIHSVSFGNTSRWVVCGDIDGTMTISDPATGELMVTLVSMRESDDWLVVTPEGQFDGSPSSWGLLLWRFAKNTFAVSPVESFFTEFFYPGLLTEVLSGSKSKAPFEIAQKDRRQPEIDISLVAAETSVTSPDKRNVTVRLKVKEAQPDQDHSEGSGAQDLRLFRNGLMVKLWSGNVLSGGSDQTLEAPVPVVAGENRFTAYAFNRENVKSADVTLSVRGDDSLKRIGTAYVLCIGVSRYENSKYNLNYSAADALAMGDQWAQQQRLVGQYNPIVVISLLNEEATRANILLALQRLAGTNVAPLAPGAPAELSKIRAAQPEDVVVIYFSGHGTAQKDRFYLIPHDIGAQGGIQAIVGHSVSDLDLEEALKPLDAEQLLLVIDACHSGQALEAVDKRRGPMNTRGLAQLAYEKGMYVLTASQSIEAAFESETFKHSYLAYALVEEGMKSGAADADLDGRVLLDEWFDYAMARVPQMGTDKLSKELELVDADERRVQRPRAFYAAKTGPQRLIVAQLSSPGRQ